MRYTIVDGKGMLHLAMNVNEHLDEGWKLQGGVCVHSIGSVIYYYQAMVLETN